MKDYNTTDQHIHKLSQILAKMGRSLVPAKEDDSHTNLYWDPIKKQLLGRWISSPGGLLLPALNLEDTEFKWIDKQMKVAGKISLVGKNYFEAEDLVEVISNDVGIEKKSLMAPLHFEIPDYTFKSAAINKLEEPELSEWSYYRTLANHILNDLGATVQRGIEVRIWPHHFDTGIYFQWSDEIGIGCGLAMEDDMAGAPYFYISAYTGDEQFNYSDATTLVYGKWIKEGPWKGGILPLNQLEMDNAIQQLQIFYNQALSYLINW
jgi:hypothetical protein